MTGNQEQQRDVRILDDIAQAVDTVVSAALGYQQRRLIFDHHEAGRIAARRRIETMWAAGGQHEKWRSLNQLPVMRMDERDLLGDGRGGGCIEQIL